MIMMIPRNGNDEGWAATPQVSHTLSPFGMIGRRCFLSVIGSLLIHDESCVCVLGGGRLSAHARGIGAITDRPATNRDMLVIRFAVVFWGCSFCLVFLFGFVVSLFFVCF